MLMGALLCIERRRQPAAEGDRERVAEPDSRVAIRSRDRPPAHVPVGTDQHRALVADAVVARPGALEVDDIPVARR
jgi:hypothetical protein